MRIIYKYITFLPLIFIMFSCAAKQQNTQYAKYGICDDFMAWSAEKNKTNKAIAYIDDGSIFIQVSHWWEDITIEIHNGKFQTAIFGAPFAPIEVSYAVLEQQLWLNKDSFIAGDELCGYYDIKFEYNETETIYNAGSETSHEGEKLNEIRSFSGMIHEIVREKNFDPFDDKNFMTFDLSTAINELGEPLKQESFNTLHLSGFRTALINHFPSSSDILILELTWDSSETREISDGGVERLTIWYIERNNRYLPVTFLRWNKDTD